MSADLAHILQDAGVPMPVQYRLTQAFKNVRRFAAYADDRPGVRAALRTDIGLEATDMNSRSAVAAAVAAWEACRDYAAKGSGAQGGDEVLRDCSTCSSE